MEQEECNDDLTKISSLKTTPTSTTTTLDSSSTGSFALVDWPLRRPNTYLPDLLVVAVVVVEYFLFTVDCSWCFLAMVVVVVVVFLVSGFAHD